MKNPLGHPALRGPTRRRGEEGQAIFMGVAMATVFLAAGTSVALTV